MDIDISKLSTDELIALNHKIVHRIRTLRQAEAHVEMAKFDLGDRVSFESKDGGHVTGIVSRLNRKTVTIITDDGGHWNVSPHLLTKNNNKTKQSQKALQLKLVD